VPARRGGERRTLCGPEAGRFLLPFVTLGSLINFCDCLMAEARAARTTARWAVPTSTSTTRQTATRPRRRSSGDVPRGVMLNQPPIFLGGQGGAVVRCAWDTERVVAAARFSCRTSPRTTSSSPPCASGFVRDREPHTYKNLVRIVRNNVIYLANWSRAGELVSRGPESVLRRRRWGLSCMRPPSGCSRWRRTSASNASGDGRQGPRPHRVAGSSPSRPTRWCALRRPSGGCRTAGVHRSAAPERRRVGTYTETIQGLARTSTRRKRSGSRACRSLCERTDALLPAMDLFGEGILVGFGSA